MSQKLYDDAYLEQLLVFFDGLKRHSYERLELQPGQVVADVGCGTGKDALRLSETGATIIGIDHDPELIAIAKQNSGGLAIHFICGEVDNVPLADQSLDAIRYDRIFQHLPNYEAALIEAYRVLKPNGLIQIIDLDYLSLTMFLEDEILERKIIDSVAHQRLPNAYKVRQLPNTLRRASFSIESIEVHNYLVTDFTFLNYAIRFSEQVPMLLKNGVLNQSEFELWQEHTNRPETQFTASLNMLIFMARKN